MKNKIKKQTNRAIKTSSEEFLLEEYPILNNFSVSTSRHSAITKNKKEELIAFIDAVIDGLDN